MTHEIFCQKLQKQAQGLAFAPLPGELGQRIYQHISQEAWQLWLQQQTMLINEYRLNMTEVEARTFLMTEMEKFLFGSGSEKPAGYQAP
ncbi:MAG TPA: oxidative damage protection protein [Gammaproteobacteria bacterium]|nr:oxidative damage protection protein [Gammaproteobacteria bacterium]